MTPPIDSTAGGFRQSGWRTLAELALVVVPLALVAFALRGCEGNVTDAIVARLPPEVDAKVGGVVAEVQRAAHGVTGASGPDPAHVARVERVFAEVRGALRPDEGGKLLGLRITTVRDETPNAFALPGGEVFVLSGLLARAGDDDDVVRGVLAHELGHAVHRHGMRMLVRSQLASLALSLVLGDVVGMSKQLVGAAASLESLRYGRAMEDEADAFGADLLARMGRGPEGLARFLESLGSQPVPTLLSTHPDPAERARALRARAPAPPAPSAR